MIVERTHYHALPGRADDVLATRRRASAVRVSLGLPFGTIAVKADPSAEGPDVSWECAFPDPEAHARDLATRDQSPAFAAVRGDMVRLLARFERHVLRGDGDAGGGDDRTPDPGSDGGPIDVTGPGVAPARVRIPSGVHELQGFFYRPTGPGPHPALVVNHGSTINRGTTDLCRPGMAALLLGWGYAVLMPHRRGYGESPGPGWRDEVPGSTGEPAYDRALAARLTAEADDVRAGADFLVTQPRIDAGRLGVLGSSFGGTVSLLAAASDRRFRCAVDFAGAAMNWERTPVLRETMLEAARQLAVPICLVQAVNDYSVAPTRELAAELARLGKPHLARVYPAFGLTADEGHLFAWTGAQVWGPLVQAFLRRWMASPAPRS